MTVTGSLSDAATLAGVLPDTIRQWARRGKIPAPTGGVWDLTAIERYLRERAACHHNRAVASLLRRGETRRTGVSLATLNA